jgi:predicted dinucleotide-binding enzyme
MKIGVLGTGMVGEAIGSKLVALQHEVMMGSRSAQNERALAWARQRGSLARAGSFADAARFGELLFNCTNGAHSIDALRAAGADNLSEKILIDVANVLPPDPARSEALAEQIQKAFADVKVIKTLNTVNCAVMVEPSRVRGPHSVFICGNDTGAKETVSQVLESFGWKDIIDLGDVTQARATEAYLELWLSLRKRLGTSDFNVQVIR